jgi:hypothetical protein
VRVEKHSIVLISSETRLLFDVEDWAVRRVAVDFFFVLDFGKNDGEEVDVEKGQKLLGSE